MEAKLNARIAIYDLCLVVCLLFCNEFANVGHPGNVFTVTKACQRMIHWLADLLTHKLPEQPAESYTNHYSDVIMSTMVSQITGVSIVYSTVRSGADQRKYQSSASLSFVRGIRRWPVNSPHKGPVAWKMFPFDDVIMNWSCLLAVIKLLFKKMTSTHNSMSVAYSVRLW